MKDLYNKNYVTQKKDIEENTVKWKDPYHIHESIEYYENGHINKSDSQIQCNIQKRLNDILYIISTKT
jgi:hypothetical protein